MAVASAVAPVLGLATAAVASAPRTGRKALAKVETATRRWLDLLRRVDVEQHKLSRLAFPDLETAEAYEDRLNATVNIPWHDADKALADAIRDACPGGGLAAIVDGRLFLAANKDLADELEQNHVVAIDLRLVAGIPAELVRDLGRTGTLLPRTVTDGPDSTGRRLADTRAEVKARA
jgi:hypothetical protein